MSAKCAWCGKPLAPGDDVVSIGGKPVHAVPCEGEFAEWTATEVEPEILADGSDARWSLVTSATPVNFDGVSCRWRDLMLADRKTVAFGPDGRLVGGYRF